MTSYEFEDLMEIAFKKGTILRQRMRLRHLKVRREIDNGKQKKL